VVTLARGILLAGLAASAAACVPRGDPPAGRQLVADRTSRLGGFVRSNGDGITRVLITRPAASGKEFSLDLIVPATTLKTWRWSQSDGPTAPPP
jgi:hypothetical protein